MSRGGRRQAIFGETVREAVEVRAERLVAEGLRRMGWSEATLQVRRKGDPEKAELARELRARTTLPMAWIAERLCMGRDTSPGCSASKTKPNRPCHRAGAPRTMTFSLTDPYSAL
jgi:hypothetical protein